MAFEIPAVVCNSEHADRSLHRRSCILESPMAAAAAARYEVGSAAWLGGKSEKPTSRSRDGSMIGIRVYLGFPFPVVHR